MPELPDVEVFKRYLNATSLHKKIGEVTVNSRDMLQAISAPRLKRRLKWHRLESTHRHGKYLFVEVNGGPWLLLHFGMTGFLKYFKHQDKEPPHNRLLITFTNGFHLAYDCQRKLGRIGLVENPGPFIEEKGLGPDALDPHLTFSIFREALAKRRGSIKSALMNQKALAGIGNVYSDEILFRAGLCPKEEPAHLSEERLKKLFQAMREDVLPTAIHEQADPARFPETYLTPHRKAQEECPKCGTPIQKMKITGRTAYVCSTCQGGR